MVFQSMENQRKPSSRRLLPIIKTRSFLFWKCSRKKTLENVVCSVGDKLSSQPEAGTKDCGLLLRGICAAHRFNLEVHTASLEKVRCSFAKKKRFGSSLQFYSFLDSLPYDEGKDLQDTRSHQRRGLDWSPKPDVSQDGLVLSRWFGGVHTI